jgi:hypothetical protein
MFVRFKENKMKKLCCLILLTITLFFIVSPVFSEEPEPRYSIQINPISHLVDLLLHFPIFEDYNRIKLDMEFQYAINEYRNVINQY